MLNLFTPDRKKLSILIYHRVHDVAHPVDEMTAELFDWHMSVLAKKFNVLPLSIALEKLQNGTLPRNAASITFDDGYRDNLEIAAPILKKWGFSATFFISVGYLNNGIMWNDKIIESILNSDRESIQLDEIGVSQLNISSSENKLEAIHSILPKAKYLDDLERHRIADLIHNRSGVDLPDNLMLTPDGVRSLRDAGMEIGAHTVTHPILAKLDKVNVQRELLESKKYLEDLLTEEIDLFAYPNGKVLKDYNSETLDVLKSSGFKAALTTEWGVATSNTDMLQLPRFTPWDRDPLKFNLRLKALRFKNNTYEI